MNQQQFEGLVNILQQDADLRHQTTIAMLQQPSRYDDGWSETIFESYISYVDGINKVLGLLAEKEQLSYSPIKNAFRLPHEPHGENID